MNDEEKQETELEQEGTTEETEEVTLESEEKSEDKKKTSTESEDSGDPLDKLSHEDLLGEAKKIRAINNRKDKSDKVEIEVEKVEKPKSTETLYMTKKDFELSNEKKAIRIAKESSEEISENFGEISKFYTIRAGRETPEDIFEDIKDAHTLWKSKQPSEEEETEKNLATSSVAKPSGKAPEKKDKPSLVTFPGEEEVDLAEKWYGSKK